MLFEYLEGCLDEVAKIVALPLIVFNLVSQINILCLHQVQNGQDLTVVRHQGFSNGVRASDKSLQNLKGDCHDLRVTRVQGSWVK